MKKFEVIAKNKKSENDFFFFFFFWDELEIPELTLFTASGCPWSPPIRAPPPKNIP